MGIIKTQAKTVTGLSVIVAALVVIMMKLGIGGGGFGIQNTSSDVQSNQTPQLQRSFDVSFFFNQDKIFYSNREVSKKEIGIEEFENILKEVRKNKQVIQLSFVEAATTRGFQDKIMAYVAGIVHHVEMIRPK